MLWHLKKGELAFEPFSGSGTAIIAAEMTGRRCYAIEQEPSYVDIAVARWEQFTGKKAERISAATKSRPDVSLERLNV
jgi:DNA modification methylase